VWEGGGTDPKGLGAIRKHSDRITCPKDGHFTHSVPYIKVVQLILIQFQLFFHAFLRRKVSVS
jgi:hypothetical protein